MIKKLYVVRDTLADNIVGGVLVFPNDPPAVRFFVDILGEKSSVVGRHPDDHSLLYIGSLDESNGSIELPEHGPVVVTTGSAIISMQEAKV
ncbi:MAG: nonstructural protein [Arizlama microvirus]|nr:MAG: nonstructural protein [Arizlama microvirus]